MCSFWFNGTPLFIFLEISHVFFLMELPLSLSFRDQPCVLSDGTTPCQATFGFHHNFDFNKEASQFEVSDLSFQANS